jgi:hypothetical protein
MKKSYLSISLVFLPGMLYAQFSKITVNDTVYLLERGVCSYICTDNPEKINDKVQALDLSRQDLNGFLQDTTSLDKLKLMLIH